MDSILVFGAGENQRTLIRSAKQLGFRTVVIDPNPNAPARDESDVFLVVGAKDKKATVDVAKKYDIKGLITSQMENPLILMAEIAEEQGFIFPSKEGVIRARNKWEMKKALIRNNVPCAKGRLFKKEEIIREDLLEELAYPLILKPTDAYSSRGVYKIDQFAEIDKYLQKTRMFSTTGDVIIEEMIDGPMFSVEAVTCNRKTTIIQYTERYKFTDYPLFVELGHIQPATLSKEQTAEIDKIVYETIEALGIDNCGTHTELRYSAEGPKIIETAARLGGDFNTSHLVPLSTGINIEKLLIQISMGITPELPKRSENYSMIKWLEFKEGERIKKTDQCSDLIDGKKIIDAKVFLKPEEIVPFVTDSAKRGGYILVTGSSRHEVISITERAEKEIHLRTTYF